MNKVIKPTTQGSKVKKKMRLYNKITQYQNPQRVDRYKLTITLIHIQFMSMKTSTIKRSQNFRLNSRFPLHTTSTDSDVVIIYQAVRHLFITIKFADFRKNLQILPRLQNNLQLRSLRHSRNTSYKTSYRLKYVIPSDCE